LAVIRVLLIRDDFFMARGVSFGCASFRCASFRGDGFLDGGFRNGGFRAVAAGSRGEGSACAEVSVAAA